MITHLVPFDASGVLVVYGMSGDLGKVLGGVLSVEQGHSFLECQVLGLSDEEIEVDKLKSDPANVDDVVPPCECTCCGSGQQGCLRRGECTHQEQRG